MLLSIIIPTFNEQENIGKLIQHLKRNINIQEYEIIVSDAGSTDDTIKTANELGTKTIISPFKGRAGQMNYGVQFATGTIYYFVHADSLPVASFFNDIKTAIQNGYNCGSFRFQFDSKKILLRINSYFTRFNYLFCRGGDQTIFVTKDLFNKVGPFKDDMLIMEDYDFLNRIWQQGNFKLIPKATIVSARKYEENSWLTVQLANLKIVNMYKKGASQQEMILKYEKLLSYRKNAF
ncbi:MAG: rSAM/selenodomain-associated transferase 2 [Flavobacterium sp.]|jgi:rSAM/selenodomain-associated transferase 2